MGRSARILVSVLVCVLFGVSAAPGQQVTGSIVGTVTDNSGAVVPGASLTLTHQETGVSRNTQSDAHGDFTFNALPPGAYSLTVEQPGFKKYAQKNINLPPNERLPVGSIQLAVGELTETISVTAEGAVVQTASSERSGLVTGNQIQNLTVVNRSFTSLISLLPGVVTSAQTDVLGWGGNMTFNVQGGRQTSNNFTLDGLPIVDLGWKVRATGSTRLSRSPNGRRITPMRRQVIGGRRRRGLTIRAEPSSGDWPPTCISRWDWAGPLGPNSAAAFCMPSMSAAETV